MDSNPISSRRTVTSQWGEDGVIEEIFRRIGNQNRFCVEFGAWDGKHLSNTWNLWHESGWSGLLIEGDSERCRALALEVEVLGRVRVCNAFVSATGEYSIDVLLKKHSAPADLDLLSIDVDGDDYYIFESLKEFRPRLILIEFNPTVPPHVQIVQAPGNYFGASASALVALAWQKGYKLVCCTQTNCFFVREEDFPALDIGEPALEKIFPPDHLRYVITSQDGRPYLDRSLIYGPPLRSAPRVGFLRRKPRPHPKLLGPDAPIPVEVFLP